MFRAEWFESKVKSIIGHRATASLCFIVMISAFFCLSASVAVAQGTSEFTLQAASFSPDAVAPGGTSSSIIQVGSVNGFTGTVNLSCEVTSTQQFDGDTYLDLMGEKVTVAVAQVLHGLRSQMRSRLGELEAELDRLLAPDAAG